MVFKNICVIVLLMEVALVFGGLTISNCNLKYVALGDCHYYVFKINLSLFYGFGTRKELKLSEKKKSIIQIFG